MWSRKGTMPRSKATAELETANMTFGMQSVYVTTGPWKQVLEPYGKQLGLPSRVQALPVSKGRELMRLPAQGISPYGSLLQHYARNACNDGVLPFITCVTLSLGEQK